MSAHLRIAVVQGGPSSEAAVSRVSAAGVFGALTAAGHTVVRLELDASLADALLSGAFDVVFPVAHGAVGEDGSLQGLLEVLGLPYVGSGVLASALACDKIVAKRLFVAAGLPLAKDATVSRGEDTAAAAVRVRAALGAAIVVKPHAQGSAIGVTRLPATASDADVARAIDEALLLDDTALCEKFVVGREMTCGVLDVVALAPTRALPPTEVIANLADYYDFASRYAAGGSQHRCPAPLSPAVMARVQQVALGAFRALGCRDLARADILVGDGDDLDAVTLLEINTMPGMTPTSLFPEAAAVDGVPMQALCDALARQAHVRGGRGHVRVVAMP